MCISVIGLIRTAQAGNKMPACSVSGGGVAFQNKIQKIALTTSSPHFIFLWGIDPKEWRTHHG
jgi:hypothetical protein